ncbi:MAG: hypothetical protein A2161_19565 [Candidatus Schekmanbacteria bacterium RBG_13_48_7]|uniref:ATP synthase subunit I n=1 Tax=Candidatus Schekmanbacteria bacterium RBG_13_48_7 TaxID=1817878 RepID=A0A1F7S2A8_9BACT|nr:MAG: hypothetical protein A2161_19565 [Candidatus Schekmanbacteria bacterium RBG_13_48_7]
MIIPVDNYRSIPRDSFFIIAVLAVFCFFFCRHSTSFGITIGGLMGIGSYLSIMIMVSWFLGLPGRKLRWMFPLFFVFKYGALITVLYYVVITPQINIIGFFLGFSIIFFVIFWKGLMNLWYMFKFKDKEKGSY